MRFLIGLIIIAGLGFGFWKLISIDFDTKNQTVSGVVYNYSDDRFISGNTKFAIRASEDTLVN